MKYQHEFANKIKELILVLLVVQDGIVTSVAERLHSLSSSRVGKDHQVFISLVTLIVLQQCKVFSFFITMSSSLPHSCGE